jgi:hypothetical protein
MIPSEFVTYEQALALKELGFNKKTLAQYSTHIGNEWVLSPNNLGEGQFTGNNGACIAPTYSQAFRWFREKYDLQHYVKKSYEFKKYFYTITRDGIIIDGTTAIDIGNTYEEAESACLDKLIEIVKNK